MNKMIMQKMKETALPSGQRVGLSDSYSGVLGFVTSIYQSPLVSTCIKKLR